MSNGPRPMKRRELEIILQSLKGLDSYSAKLEQYPTPPSVASDILFTAKSLGDIDGKTIGDLGCGNGIFGIGAKLMGAERVIGIDIHEDSVALALENSRSLGLDIDYQVMDIKDLEKRADVVLQNPPFGSQKKHADRPFLEKAMEIGDVVYTIHMAETHEFIGNMSGALGFQVDMVKEYEFELKHSQRFHKKERAFIDVAMFRLVRL